MAIDTSMLKFKKGEPRIVVKQAKKAKLAKQERECRIAVRKRDKGKCVVPGCKEGARHLHHITFRSHGGKWTSANCCSLCPIHHQLLHNGKIHISGNADEHLTITGEKRYLRFTL